MRNNSLIRIRMIHADHPMTEWSWRCVDRRKMRTKISFAAVWAYSDPAIKKFGMAIPYAAFAHFGGKELKAGDATSEPM